MGSSGGSSGGKGSRAWKGIKASGGKPREIHRLTHDPAGVVDRSDNKDVLAVQADQDWAGVGASPKYGQLQAKETEKKNRKEVLAEMNRKKRPSLLTYSTDDEKNNGLGA